MKIKWYGTATLLFESGGTYILIDPYLKSLNKKLPRVPLGEAALAQAIFITHSHLDHFADIDAFTQGGTVPVYVSQNGIARAKANGLNASSMQPLFAGGEYRAGEFTVRAYQSRHCRFDAATVLRIVFSPRTYFLFGRTVRLLKGIRDWKITDDIFALEICDREKSVVVLGSAGMDGDTAYPKGADLLVFPYQGRTRLDEYMLPFLDAFEPKVVMADHFDNAFPPFSHRVSVKKFAPAVRERLKDARAIVPEENEWYEV